MEKKFNEYSEAKLKSWISEKKILFVTNSTLMPGGMYLSSLRTYIDYIPIHNMFIVPGLNNDKPYYGIKVFYEMTMRCIIESLFKKYDYIIYIDEDAFVNDFHSLMNIFYDFYKNDEYCMAGIQDGGVICHRTHSKLMVNTFVSFWNIKKLRDNNVTPNMFNDVINMIVEKNDESYLKFRNIMKENHNDLYLKMNELADKNIERVKEYREKNFINGEVPYCETVKNDPNNPIEPHQIPYSFKDEKENNNFEPYYVIEQAYILLTGCPIYYMYATDLFNKEETECDNSGLTSVILNDEDEPVVVHTWFTRAYTKYPVIEKQLYHTNRINTVIEKYGKL